MNEVDTRLNLIEVNFHFSRQLLVLFILCHGAGLLALSLANIAFGVKILISLFLLLHFVLVSRRYVFLKSSESLQSVRLLNNQWRVKTSRGWQRAWPKGEVVVTAMLICFRMTVEDKTHPVSMILCSDGAGREEIHKLRLKLILDADACLRTKTDKAIHPFF